MYVLDTILHLKSIVFIAVKNCSILHGHVFVMLCCVLSTYGADIFAHNKALIHQGRTERFIGELQPQPPPI